MNKESQEKSMNAVGQRIKERTEVRQQTAEQKRATQGSEYESAHKFYESFAKMKGNIIECLDDNQHKDKDALDSIRHNTALLQQYLNEASMYLPAFQLKKSQESIDMLTGRHKSIQNELFPKKKFGFKSKPIINTSVSSVADSPSNQSSDAEIAALVESTFFGFRNISNSTLSKSAAEIKNQQLNLQNLTNCKVQALGNPQSLQMDRLINCTVHIGPTTRSAFIKNCTNCTVVLACQQVRIHSTTNCSFYLHVTGSAIIEDCKTVTFSPYNLTYQGLEEHYVESGLSRHINKWDKVEDFNWLNENEKSPNFSLVTI